MISITSAPEAPPPRIRILDSRAREVETVRIGDKLTFRIEIPEDSELNRFFLFQPTEKTNIFFLLVLYRTFRWNNVQNSARSMYVHRIVTRVFFFFPAPYGIFARSCVAMAKDSKSTFQIIDDEGCPVDPTIFPGFSPEGNALQSVYEAFRFTESYGVIFQCNVKYCLGPCEPVIILPINQYKKNK